MPFSAVLLLGVNPYIKCLVISCLKDVPVYDNFVLCDGYDTYCGSAGEIVSILMMSQKTRMKIQEATVFVARAALWAGFDDILVVSKFNDLDRYNFGLVERIFSRELDFTHIEPDSLASYLKGFYERKDSVQGSEAGSCPI